MLNQASQVINRTLFLQVVFNRYISDLFPQQVKFSRELDFRLVSMTQQRKIFKFLMVSMVWACKIRRHFLLFAFGPRCLISTLPVVTELCKCISAWIGIRVRLSPSPKSCCSRQVLSKWNASAGFCLAFFVLTRDPWVLHSFKFLTGEITLAGQETARTARMSSSECFFLSLLLPPCWHLEAFHNDCKFLSLKKNLYSAQKRGLYCVGPVYILSKNPLRDFWCGCAIFFRLEETLLTCCLIRKWELFADRQWYFTS